MSAFDRRVDDSDEHVFSLLGVLATVTPPATEQWRGELPLAPVWVIYDNEFRIQGDDGGFINTYGGRSDGLMTDCHFLQFQKKEWPKPINRSRFYLVDGRVFSLSEVVDEDQFVWTYAVTPVFDESG